MNIDSQLLFFFSALGAFNGLLLGCYFFFYAKPKHISNYFLGALLITLSVRIGKSVFFYFNPDLSLVFLQIGLTACFFIGPSLYFYLRSMIKTEAKDQHLWKLHMAVLVPLILIVSYIYPWQDHFTIIGYYFVRAIYLEWLIYLVASGFLLRGVFKRFWDKKDKLNSKEIWILSVFIGNVIVWVAYNTVAYTSYIVGAVSFSFIFYLLILLLLLNKKRDSILFKRPPKYADKKIAAPEADLLLERLEQVMVDQELYKDPKLKLPDVAKELDILAHRLSQLINDNLEKTFPLFVNEYRVNEAKKLIKSNHQYTLEGIGYECGFNSKSTFYSTFKKLTGTTPAQYKNHL